MATVETFDCRHATPADSQLSPASAGDEWVVYAPHGRAGSFLSLLRDSLRDLWRTRELAWILFTRDLKSQVRRSVLGYSWFLSGPLMTAAMWIFLQSQQVVAIETEVPYPLFVFTGTILWSLLKAGFDATLDAYSSDILKKLNVPVEAFIARNLAGVGFQFLLALIPLTCLLLFYQQLPASTVILLPLAVAGLVMMGAAAGCLLAPLAGFFGDIPRAAQLVFTALMYLSPVVYPVRESGLLGTLMRLNPLTPVLQLCRDLLFGGGATSAPAAIPVVLGSTAMFLAGLVLLRLAKPHVVARKGM